MNKADLINDVCYEMSAKLEKDQLDWLRVTLNVKLQYYDLAPQETLPAVTDKTNEWIMKRYVVDGLAKGLEKSSVQAVLYSVKGFLDWSRKHYTQISGQDLTDFLAYMQYERKVSPGYKASLYRQNKMFWKWAYEKGHTDTDVMRTVDRVKTPKVKKERLTDEEVEIARDNVIDLREDALQELLLSTGMRVGEVGTLKIGDYDRANRRIKIYGEKTNEYRYGMLNIRAARALDRYITDRPSGDPIFIPKNGKAHPLSTGTIEGIIKGIAKRAGITRIPVTVHTYRKTFASIIYRKTQDIYLVSKLLGHSNIDVTIKFYLVDDMEEIQFKFERVS